ncbi:serine hydrolase domain-containing protein [Labilibaculum euxinus]
MRIIIAGLLASVFFIYFSCINHTAKTTTSNTIVPFLDSIAQSINFNGAIIFKENNRIIFKKAYGIANYDLQTQFTPSTQMEIASLSKQFTSMAVLILREQGKLDLDHPVNEYLDVSLDNDSLTIKQLLTHTSGISKYEKYFKTHWDKEKKCMNKDILDYYLMVKPDFLFKPGTKFDYNNGGYVILAEVVNHISGMSLDKFLKENVFHPYGFKNTGFYDREKLLMDMNFAPGWIFDSLSTHYVLPESIPGNEHYSFLNKRLGPGRLVSTIEEMALWDSLLSENLLLSEKAYLEMYTPQQIPGVKNNYALGWRVNTDQQYGWHTYHTGSWAGNKTYISRFSLNPIKTLKKDSYPPDQTLIIFNNTNMNLKQTLYNKCDSIVIRYRKRIKETE